MENFTRESNSQLFSMEVDDQAKSTFLEMARWTKFLAILGFIFLGFMVLGGMAVAMFFSSNPSISSQFGPLGSMGSIGLALMYIVIAGVFFYPTYSMMKYATGVKRSLQTLDKAKFNESINHLKNSFKFYGIMSIIFLGLYGIIVVISILSVAR